MLGRDLEKAREEPPGIGATPDRQKVDQLDQQAGLAVARLAHDPTGLREPRHEPVVTDP